MIYGAQAQNKQLTLEDACWLNAEVYPQSMSNLQWKGNSNTFTYTKDNAIVAQSTKSATETTLLTLNELNTLVTKTGIDSLKHIPAIRWTNNHTFYFVAKNNIVSVDTKTQTATKQNSYPQTAENISLDKAQYHVAYTRENNLFMSINGNETAVTHDTNPGIVNGQAVHRREFGIEKGIFWSPKGNLLAFYHKDETMVTDYPLVEVDARVAHTNNIKYPMAGMPSHHVTLGVFNHATGKTVFMQTGEPVEQYLTAVTWGPDEQYIYIGLLNRGQNHLKLNQYDATSGKFIKTLFEEQDDQWVEPENGLTFLHNNANQFIWQSERDGWNHLYLYNTDGKLIKQLTKGQWMVSELKGLDSKNRKAYYMSTEVSPIQQHLYSVDLRNGKRTRITPQHGTHSPMVNENGSYALDIYSSTEIAREYQLLTTKGKTQRTLMANKNPLEDYSMGKMEMGTLKATDGTDLYYRIILPPNFDPNKKYPVFHYVYGGPHLQMITDSWLGGAGLFQNYVAQQGYIVFNMDNRGTPNRGLEFEQRIHRNLGTVEVDDQMQGIKYLKTLPYVDADNIGVDGWSYGGFMTISLTTQNPGVFKAACAGGPVIDWKWYEVMYGERYMDTPQENPDGYAHASLLDKVDSLQGHLMIMHGTVDPTVVWQNSLMFIKKSVEAGKQVDYFVYPNHEHNVRGIDRVHMYQKIMNFFDLHLRGIIR